MWYDEKNETEALGMIVLRGGSVVNGEGVEQRDVYIENGKIVEGGTPDEVVDVGGKLLFPGFIDSHTHLDMPVSGTVTADDFATGTAAAIAGGTTVILDFATQERGGTLAEALALWHSRADGRCAADYGFHMAVTDWNEATRREMGAMLGEGVASFKAYMAYDALRLGDDELREMLREAGRLGCYVGVHCELGDEVNRRVAAELAAGHTAPKYHPLSRPNEVEAEAIKRLLTLSAEADAPCWVVHLSTHEGLAAIEAARAKGQRVLVESCPQYLTLTDEVYARPGFEGAKFVCSPPIRKSEDKAALWRAAADGEVDIISTDHCSFNFKNQKELGLHNFALIPNGLPGLEQRPALIWSEGVAKGRITAQQMCALLAEGPAKAFGLWGQKGALLPGFDADIVVWDPGYRGAITAAAQETNCDYSPWEGHPITGRAERVYLRGELAAENGRCLRRGGGCFVRRKPAF